MRIITVGTSENPASLDTNFENSQDNFTELYGRSVNVLDYGATGDGITDDTAAIQAALSSGEKNLCIPVGASYYKISASLLISSDINIYFEQGAVFYSVINEDSYAEANILFVNNTAGNVKVVVENGTFESDGVFKSGGVGASEERIALTTVGVHQENYVNLREITLINCVFKNLYYSGCYVYHTKLSVEGGSYSDILNMRNTSVVGSRLGTGTTIKNVNVSGFNSKAISTSFTKNVIYENLEIVDAIGITTANGSFGDTSAADTASMAVYIGHSNINSRVVNILINDIHIPFKVSHSATTTTIAGMSVIESFDGAGYIQGATSCELRNINFRDKNTYSVDLHLGGHTSYYNKNVEGAFIVNCSFGSVDLDSGSYDVHINGSTLGRLKIGEGTYWFNTCSINSDVSTEALLVAQYRVATLAFDKCTFSASNDLLAYNFIYIRTQYTIPLSLTFDGCTFDFANQTSATPVAVNFYDAGSNFIWRNNRALNLASSAYSMGLTVGNVQNATVDLVFNNDLSSGGTSERPVIYSFFENIQYFDTTLGRPIWNNGSGWTDASGVAQ